MTKRIFALLLILAVVLSAALPALAEEPGTEVVCIYNASGLRLLSSRCRLDTGSLGLTVKLMGDIDMTGEEFYPIPIFGGTFLGGGHKITGLNLEENGSFQGFFRYLTATARVDKLHLEGNVAPSGSAGTAGGIAGENLGIISGCSFTGTVTGGDRVGGIVGSNGLMAIVENCNFEGEIRGNHFIGGIAGENLGVIRLCHNSGHINADARDNRVDLQDITLETITGAESAGTVTDIGGIAGLSSGVIRDCINWGTVGYPQMGYNVGGIAGTQSGYITESHNYGEIRGRKEVGGIVGQMEPTAYIQFSIDALQILREQLNGMSGLVNRASGNAQGNAGKITEQIGVLQGQTETAMDAVISLMPDPENPEPPDEDAINAARNVLSATVKAMPGTINGISAATQNTITNLSRDLQAIAGQVSAMGKTLDEAAENIGGTITDISDEDTAEQLTGKVSACINYGTVLADMNAGGIAGAMAMENDLDLLEDWESHGNESLNFESRIRAVLLDCSNKAAVTCHKQNGGGIVGWQALGLVKNCTNIGLLEASGASYVGGIAGLSTGYLRQNNARCRLEGSSCVGGIAGSGTVVSDCVSVSELASSGEKLGAVLGTVEEHPTEVENPLANNRFLPTHPLQGAIDGISYAGVAEPISLEEFLAIEGMPLAMQTVTLRFDLGRGESQSLSLRLGGSLSMEQIPALRTEEGETASWADLQSEDLQNILCDRVFHALITTYRTVIRSEQTRDSGLPLVLAQGSFSEEAWILAQPLEEQPSLEEKQLLLECWQFTSAETCESLRFHLGEEVDPERLVVLLRGSDGSWQTVPFRTEGRYVIFETNSTEGAFATALNPPDYRKLYISIAAGAAALAALTGLIVASRKKQKQLPPDPPAEKA